MQSCKKSSPSDSTDTATTVLFNDYLNGVLWTPKTVNATLTYNASAQTKTFTCIATDTLGTGKIVLNLSQPATTVDSTLMVAGYTDTTYCKPLYYTIANGVSTSAGPIKSAYINITAYDAVKKLATGTFGFTQLKLNYDGAGNVTSVTSTSVSAGQFNNLPFTFIKK